MVLADLAECHEMYERVYQLALLYKANYKRQVHITTLKEEKLKVKDDDIELYQLELEAIKQAEKRSKRIVFWQKVGIGVVAVIGTYTVVKLNK